MVKTQIRTNLRRNAMKRVAWQLALSIEENLRSACVWASHLGSGNFGWFRPWFGPGVPEGERLARSGQLSSYNLLGLPVPKEDFPAQTLAIRGTPKGGRNVVICENRNILVSDDMAAFLSGFDLGAGGLFPNRIVKHNKSREIVDLGFQMNYWHFGNRKKTLRHGDPKGVRRFFNPSTGITPESGIEVWITPPYYNLQPDDLAFGSECLDGPDIWVEAGVNITLFLSDRIVQGLRRKRWDKVFNLRRCRVVP